MERTRSWESEDLGFCSHVDLKSLCDLGQKKGHSGMWFSQLLSEGYTQLSLMGFWF